MIFFDFFFLYRRSSAIMSWSSTHVLFWTGWGTLCAGGHPNDHFRRCRLQGSNPCSSNPNNKYQRPNRVGHLDPPISAFCLSSPLFNSFISVCRPVDDLLRVLTTLSILFERFSNWALVVSMSLELTLTRSDSTSLDSELSLRI